MVDGGNFRLPGDAPDPEHDAFLLRELVAMGYSVLGVGVDDLRHGVASLRALVAGSGLTLVACNILDAESGEPLFAPYQVLEVGPSRIGFTGVLAPQLWDEQAAAVPGVRVSDPAAALAAVLAELHERCDLVVCFLHEREKRLPELLDGVEGIDIGVACYRSVPRNYPRRIGNLRPVFVTGGGGRFIGWSRLELEPGVARYMAGKIHFLRFGLPEDPEIEQRVAAFLAHHGAGAAPGETGGDAGGG